MGGVHPSENKLSCAKPIEVLPLPDVVTIPLAQHIGAPAVAKVAKGDRVLTGQLIAEAGSFMSANIHSPISGTVTAVDMVVNGQGLRQMMITIKREGDDWAEGIDRSDALVKVCPFSRFRRRSYFSCAKTEVITPRSSRVDRMSFFIVLLWFGYTLFT